MIKIKLIAVFLFITIAYKMPEIEIDKLVWLVWGASLIGLQSSISISLNLKKRSLLPIGGSIYFLLIFCLSLFLQTEPVFFYKILIFFLVIGFGVSLVLLLQMIRKKKWCGICLRVHFANVLLLVTTIEAWPRMNLFNWLPSTIRQLILLMSKKEPYCQMFPD